MSLIDWTDDLSVGVKEIDGQHKKLVDMLNRLHDAMKERKSNDVLGGILNEMIRYTVVHFQTEEKYFKEFNYKDADMHIAEHKKLVNKVSEFQKDFKAGKVALSVQIKDFLKNWLIHHIQGTDKLYTECFNSNGLK